MSPALPALLALPLFLAEIIGVPGRAPTIQDAIDLARDGDEIVVSPGRYDETLDTAGKAVIVRSTDPADPAVVAATVVNAGRRGPVLRCAGGEGRETVLDGLTLTGGLASRGGGVYALASSPTLRRCVLAANAAQLFGGGLYANGGDPLVTDCTFNGNTAAIFGGGAYLKDTSAELDGCAFETNSAASGGGVFGAGADLVLRDCRFTANESTGSGGGLFAGGGRPRLARCEFEMNLAGGAGGAIEIFQGPGAVIVECAFAGNTAGSNGGALFDEADGTLISHCVFTANHATTGGAMYAVLGAPSVVGCSFQANTAASAGGLYLGAAAPRLANCTLSGNLATSGAGAVLVGPGALATVRNCILWNDAPNEIVVSGQATAAVTRSLVAGGFPGPGNLDRDPLFVDPRGGDLRLRAPSPCLDAGHNWALPPDALDLDGDGDTAELVPLDLDGAARFSGVRAVEPPGCGAGPVVDMGAYEFPGRRAGDVRLGDLDGNGAVDVADLVDLVLAWGRCDAGACCLADLDLDGAVDVADLVTLILEWGRRF